MKKKEKKQEVYVYNPVAVSKGIFESSSVDASVSINQNSFEEWKKLVLLSWKLKIYVFHFSHFNYIRSNYKLQKSFVLRVIIIEGFWIIKNDFCRLAHKFLTLAGFNQSLS